MYAILNEFNQPKPYLAPFVHWFIMGPWGFCMQMIILSLLPTATKETVMCFVWHVGIPIYFVVKLIEGHVKDIRTQCLTSEG